MHITLRIQMQMVVSSAGFRPCQPLSYECCRPTDLGNCEAPSNIAFGIIRLTNFLSRQPFRSLSRPLGFSSESPGPNQALAVS